MPSTRSRRRQVAKCPAVCFGGAGRPRRSWKSAFVGSRSLGLAVSAGADAKWPGCRCRCRGWGLVGLGEQDSLGLGQVGGEGVGLPCVAVPSLDEAGRVWVQVGALGTVAGDDGNGAKSSDFRVTSLRPFRQRFVVHLVSLRFGTCPSRRVAGPAG